MHGFLGRDGEAPSELIAAGREEVRSYGGEVLDGRVVEVRRADAGTFRLELVGGHVVVARRVLAATGIVDELPDIDGLAVHWGDGVIHCPFCHGYEVRDRRVVQIVTHPMGLHATPLFGQLTARLTVVVHGCDEVDDAAVEPIRAAGVNVERGEVRRVVEDANGCVAGVELADGGVIGADAVAVGPRFRARAEPFQSLGLRAVPHPSGLGDVVETDAVGETAVTGLYAAGNITDPSQQVLHAAADGSRVGSMIGHDLAREDLRGAARPSANETDWQHRYGEGRMWSGNPNGTLVQEVEALAPGRALDVGAGEGGDAIWLAERGWQVTATDIATVALDRIAAEATRRNLEITCLHADANGLDPYPPGEFDLVSAHYASIPRTPDDRAVRNLLDAVAPGGTLLVVGHDLAPMREPIDTRTHSRGFDPDAYVRVDDFASVLARTAGWEVEVHETRPRPTGATSAHHVDDVVLRARRQEAPSSG